MPNRSAAEHRKPRILPGWKDFVSRKTTLTTDGNVRLGKQIKIDLFFFDPLALNK